MLAAQGPIEKVMQERVILRSAHLRTPWLVETGLAFQEACPGSPERLPKNRVETIAWILDLQSLEAAVP
jgi:hypothetical protein